jgi:hypothetical protein
MEPTFASGVVDALGCVGGALSFALLQPPGTPKQRVFALVIVGSIFSGFLTPWACDLLALWMPSVITDHARGGIGFLAGLGGVLLAQAVIDVLRERASAGVRIVLDRIFGPAPPQS